MRQVLDELKVRLAAAQKRHLDATARFQAAQVELQAAQVDLNVWTNAVNIETRDEALRQAEAVKDQLPIKELTGGGETSVATQQAAQAEDETNPVNKTEAVREILRQHPTGLTSPDLWKAFSELVPDTSRSYLYSVIKRLRDKDEIMQRRGKFLIKAKPLEAKHEAEGN